MGFFNTPLNERIGDSCNNIVEDKEHFIFECSQYMNLRSEFDQFVAKFHIKDMPNCDILNLSMTDSKLIYTFGNVIRNCYYK